MFVGNWTVCHPKPGGFSSGQDALANGGVADLAQGADWRNPDLESFGRTEAPIKEKVQGVTVI